LIKKCSDIKAYTQPYNAMGDGVSVLSQGIEKPLKRAIDVA
jgi:hypothetical protein